MSEQPNADSVSEDETGNSGGADIADIVSAWSQLMVVGAQSGVLWAAVLVFVVAAIISVVPWGLLMLELIPALSMATTATFLGAELIAALVTFLAFGLIRSFRTIYLDDASAVGGAGEALSDAFGKYIDVASYSIAIGFITLMLALISWFVGLDRNVGFVAGVLIWIGLSPGLYLLAIDEFTLDEGLDQGWAMFKRRWVDLIWAYLLIGIGGFVLFGGTYYALSSFANLFIEPLDLTGRLASVILIRTLIGAVSGVASVVMFTAIFIRIELTERAEEQPPEIWGDVSGKFGNSDG